MSTIGINLGNITDKTMFLRVNFRVMGNVKKVANNVVLNEQAQSEVSPGLLKVQKTLLDSPELRAIAKLDGVSVHILRFAPGGVPYGASVDEVRQAYHLRGWKHLVTNNTALGANPNAKGPLHNGTTDLWVVMDGVNVRGAVALVQSPKSLTLITMAGNISPVDMLHLRGHFGIPRFDGDQFNAAGDKQ